MPRPANIGVDLDALTGVIQRITGTTPQQKRQQAREQFYNEGLPQLANEFYAADPSDAQGMMNNGVKLMQAAQAAGLSEDEYGKILNTLTAPARAKTSRQVYDEIGKDREQRGLMMFEEDITGRPAGEGASEARQAYRSQSNFNQDDALKLARAQAEHGVEIPKELGGMLKVPSQVEHERAQKHAQAELARLRQAQAGREMTEKALVDRQLGEVEGMQGEPGVIARATRGQGLAQFLNQERDRPSLERLRGSQAGAAEALARERGAGTTANQELANLRRRTDPNIRSSGSGAGGSETVVEQDKPLTPRDVLEAQKIIGDIATARGTTSSEDLKAIASEMGMELTGDVKLAVDKNWLGFESGDPMLKGRFTLRRRPVTRTTRKGPAAASSRSPAASKEELLKRFGLD